MKDEVRSVDKCGQFTVGFHVGTADVYWVAGHKHPGGPETVLTKLEFYQKNVSFATARQQLLSLETCENWTSTFGPFWENCAFATVKRDFLVYFDRTIAAFFFTPSFAASVQFCQAASCTC